MGFYKNILILGILSPLLLISVFVRYGELSEVPGETVSYSETRETIPRKTKPSGYTAGEQDILCSNPERGFYSTSNAVLTGTGLASDYIPAASGTSSLLYLKVDLSDFSGSMNGDADKELTDKAIRDLGEILERIKQNNNTVILRFVYDGNATRILPNVTKTEPRQAMLLSHIRQLAPVFQKYASTINVIQTGFYGLWGEAYYNTDAREHPEYYQETVQALLDATKGTDITIAVRTMEYWAWHKGVTAGDLESPVSITDQTDDSWRVGIFNDACGGSESDLGTFTDREKDIQWLSMQAAHTFYGGEAIVDETSEDGVGPFNTGMKFIGEAFQTHMSYLNWEWNQAIHKAWENQAYTGSDPYYQGESVLSYIESHLGYRLVLKDTEIPKTVKSGGSLPVTVTVCNTGFANVVKEKQADLILTDGKDNVVKTYENIGLDIRDFVSQESVETSFNVTLPDLPRRNYRVYLRISSGETLDNGSYYSPIRFANDSLYSETLQANLIGSFTVKP